jgi:predicted nucleotidyltransferase
MTTDLLEILNRLHDSHVDFVIVGGVAAALQGGSRATFDLDLVPSLAPDSWAAAIDLLGSLGARPRSPDGAVEVDLLVSESDDLDALRARADKITLEGRTFFVASIDDLITMKQRAGRPQDLLDIAELEAIRTRRVL